MMGDGLAPILMLAAFVASIWLHVKLLRRIGRSGWWMLLSILFPPFYLIGVWLFAFTRWPAEDAAGGPGADGSQQGGSQGASQQGGPQQSGSPQNGPAGGASSGSDASWPYHDTRRDG